MAAAHSCRVEAVHDQTNPSQLISSAKDPSFQHLRSLQTPQGRSRSGLYLIEGIRHVARAVEEHAPIEALVVAPSVLSNPFGQKLAKRLRQSGVRTHQLAPQLYRNLTLASEPQGMGAVVRQSWTPIHGLTRLDTSLLLAVESIDSPGNLGTMMRTAEAAGVSGVVLLGQGVDPHDPVAIRASMGAVFAHQLVRSTTGEFTRWAKDRGVALVGSSPVGLLNYRGFPYPSRTALLIGSERQGLSEQLRESCDFMVRIPMAGRGDSINAAVAAGLLMYEFFHQRAG